MKPDKFDILKVLVEKEFSFFIPKPVTIELLANLLSQTNGLHNNYDESLTIEENIEKWIK